MVSGQLRLTVGSIGVSSRDAIRHLLTEFRYRGWQDRGSAAMLMVKYLEDRGEATAQQVANAAPSDFLAANGLRRDHLEDFIRDLAGRGR